MKRSSPRLSFVVLPSVKPYRVLALKRGPLRPEAIAAVVAANFPGVSGWEGGVGCIWGGLYRGCVVELRL